MRSRRSGSRTSPGACSIGIHVLLEEIGKPYDLQKIDGAKQEQYGPDFVKLNPKSKVPTLQKDDGSVLTEFPAIATWLARKNPDKGLHPRRTDRQARIAATGEVVEGHDRAEDSKERHGRHQQPCREAQRHVVRIPRPIPVAVVHSSTPPPPVTSGCWDVGILSMVAPSRRNVPDTRGPSAAARG